MNLQQVLARLNALADPEKVAIKQQKFGITASKALGVYQKDLSALAKELGRNNALALELYASGIYEARLLCSKLFDPACLTETMMDEWASSFENWEICDSFCMALFAKSEQALDKALAWSAREEEFVKRAGFVIMAVYGFSHKSAGNQVFEPFLTLVERECEDDRLYVKKAVNWALRNVGKRNVDLHRQAIALAKRLLKRSSTSAKWIASDALRELAAPDICMLDYPRPIYRPKTSEKLAHGL